jgi:hypothetical protein
VIEDHQKFTLLDPPPSSAKTWMAYVGVGILGVLAIGLGLMGMDEQYGNPTLTSTQLSMDPDFFLPMIGAGICALAAGLIYQLISED